MNETYNRYRILYSEGPGDRFTAVQSGIRATNHAHALEKSEVNVKGRYLVQDLDTLDTRLFRAVVKPTFMEI